MDTTITIPIELANKIAERAAARGLDLEEYACEVLERDVELSTGAEPFEQVSKQPPATNGASKELRWLKEHRHEYMGQWVALDGDRLVAHGTNAREVFQAAREAGVKVPFIEQILPTDDMPFVGMRWDDMVGCSR
jgi:Family of unknown function (DUF5678)